MSASNAKSALAYCRIWHEADAKGKILGRLACQVARVLMGKHKPIYHPAADTGDYVVVKNIKHIQLTGNKRKEKTYYYHTQYPGGLRHYRIQRLFDMKPDEILKKAVYGMLPKNRMRRVRMRRLFVFPGEQHPYEQNIFKNYMKQIVEPIFPLRAKVERPNV